MYLLDGSFISGVTPYVDADSVTKHPLWGSHLLLNNEDAVKRGHKDYIKGYRYISEKNDLIFYFNNFHVYLFIYHSRSRFFNHRHIPSKHWRLSKIFGPRL